MCLSARIVYMPSFQKVQRTVRESVSGFSSIEDGLTRMRRSRHEVHATDALWRRIFAFCFACDSSDEVCSSLMIVWVLVVGLLSCSYELMVAQFLRRVLWTVSMC